MKEVIALPLTQLCLYCIRLCLSKVTYYYISLPQFFSICSNLWTSYNSVKTLFTVYLRSLIYFHEKLILLWTWVRCTRIWHQINFNFFSRIPFVIKLCICWDSKHIHESFNRNFNLQRHFLSGCFVILIQFLLNSFSLENNPL